MVRTKRVLKEVITWDDNVPWMAISIDGVDLVAYFPHGIKKAAHVHNVLLLPASYFNSWIAGLYP